MTSPILGPRGRPIEIGTIFAIGRNYAAHARELGNSVPEAPMFFLKAASSAVGPGAAIPLPPGATGLDHEVELVALIGAPLSRATPAQARGAVGGWAVGIDWTDRPLQSRLKAAGKPWAQAKSFRGASCLSHFVPPEALPDPGAATLRLSVEGQVRQEGDTRDMILDVYELLSFLSMGHDLVPGDLVFTGTPSGVSTVFPGEGVKAELVGIVDASFTLSLMSPATPMVNAP